MIEHLTICGFRGFGKSQTIKFSMPNGNCGSGLSFIVGANNSGKTTISEAIKAFNGSGSLQFSEGKRNKKTGSRIYLEIKDNRYDSPIKIETVTAGGSMAIKSPDVKPNYYVIPSRRSIAYHFGKQVMNKDTYLNNYQTSDHLREPQLLTFESRLFELCKDENKQKFNDLLKKILGKEIEWTIELQDGGNYYVKYSMGDTTHNGEGIGDGIWSIFTLCVGLYDSNSNDVLVIDEPELSIHPHLQKKDDGTFY